MSWAVGSFYTVHFNPEIAFLRDSTRVKQAWARQLPAAKGPRVIFVGGSSCFTQLDAARLVERHNVRAINMGLGAGLGPNFLTRVGLSEVQAGDTLIVTIEPHLLTAPLREPAMAVQLSHALDAPDLLRHPWTDAVQPGPVSLGLSLRPGAFHMFTLIGKFLTGRPLYRYSISDVSPSGWHQVNLRRDFFSGSPYQLELSTDARRLLNWLSVWCADNHIRVAYSLPWCYVPAKEARKFREHSRNLLLQIAAQMPVLKDTALGAHSVRELYSDNAMHLDPQGAVLRTDSLAQQLINWSVWSTEELAHLDFSESVTKQASLAARPDQASTEGN